MFVIVIQKMIVLLIVQVYLVETLTLMIAVFVRVEIQDTIPIQTWTSAGFALVIMKISRDVVVLMEPLQFIGMIMMVMA